MNILEWLADENILKNTLLDLQAHEIQMTSNHPLHFYCLFVCLFFFLLEKLKLGCHQQQGRLIDVVYAHNCCQFFKWQRMFCFITWGIFLLPLFSVQIRGLPSRPSVVFLHVKPIHKKLIKYYFKGTDLCAQNYMSKSYICCLNILVKPYLSLSLIILGEENLQETLLTLAK